MCLISLYIILALLLQPHITLTSHAFLCPRSDTQMHACVLYLSICLSVYLLPLSLSFLESQLRPYFLWEVIHDLPMELQSFSFGFLFFWFFFCRLCDFPFSIRTLTTLCHICLFKCPCPYQTMTPWRWGRACLACTVPGTKQGFQVLLND
jgi:hypothetical protein